MKTILVLALLFGSVPKDYPLVLTVTKLKQTPFTRGGNNSARTNCRINGDDIYCDTANTSFAGIPGVSYLMLANASDGNTYLFGCDAQWRWSHCSGLLTEKFRARLDGGRLAVEVMDKKGKPKEIKYDIFSIESTPKEESK